MNVVATVLKRLDNCIVFGTCVVLMFGIKFAKLFLKGCLVFGMCTRYVILLNDPGISDRLDNKSTSQIFEKSIFFVVTVC